MPDPHTDTQNQSSDNDNDIVSTETGNDGIQFRAKQSGLASTGVWEYDAATNRTSRDVVQDTIAALVAPDDFPPIEAAIVAGDRVALAVDPNIPNVDSVIEGVIRMIRSSPAEQIEIVVWDEATGATLDRIKTAAGDIPVILHECDNREAQCYLAADVDAEPIYLNRALVEADFVLPIVAVRPMDLSDRRDLTGVFPSLSDSATRARFQKKISLGSASDPAMKSGNTIAEEVPWLLGVQLLLTVTANSNGDAGEIHAGTVEAISKRITPTLRRPDPVPPPASLVVAALDGDQQQQTWENVVRAAEAALVYAQPDATIVIWSSLDQPPQGALLAIDFDDCDDETEQHDGESESPATATASDKLPDWDRFAEMSRRLRRVTDQHRVMLHSRLTRETIEPMGLGVIDSAHELANLSRNYESCGVLRAASFAGGN